MPRKTRGGAKLNRPPWHGFNEAAARCRGKPRARAPEITRPRAASMRPRPDAAENLEIIQLDAQAGRVALQ